MHAPTVANQFMEFLGLLMRVFTYFSKVRVQSITPEKALYGEMIMIHVMLLVNNQKK